MELFKVRLVILGNTQQDRVDLIENFAPMAKW